MAEVHDSRDLAELFGALLAEEPDLPALVQDGRVMTFREWWSGSALAAGILASKGVRVGDVVCLLLPSGRDFAVWYLGVLRLGAVVSAINPRLGSTEIGHIIGRCHPVVVVTNTAHRVPSDAAAAVCDPRGPFPCSIAPLRGIVPVPSDAPAVISWTTGSTGLPKGAWFDYQTLRFIAENMGPLSRLHDRKLMPVPFAHAGFTTRIYDQLLHRCTLVLTPSDWSAESMLDVLETERVTVGQGVPTQWEKLIALDRFSVANLSHLRLVATGASRVPDNLITMMSRRLGCPVVVRYASTELPLAFGTRLDDSPRTVATTVGRPLGGAEVDIRSADGDSARQGRAGRIFLRSPAMMRGYWDDPEMTAQSVSNDGWLATGDLGVLDEQGNLVILGRADDTYIRGGYNVYPAEVETALLEHPAVRRVAVVGTTAPVIGEAGVAFVVTDDHALTGELVRDWCRGQIADYKVPDTVVFVPDLPVNAVFKIDMMRLRAMAADALTDLSRTT
ncbi:MAG: putative acyl-CoA synthetase [Actinomycetia bacterium]|nr:putative acyl-CoA synthetase [Actinomycetes bacterium]